MKVKIIRLLLALFYLIPLSSIFSQEPKYVAFITELKGKVNVKKSEKSDFEKTFLGTHLYNGYQVQTLANSEVSISFLDGNIIKLSSNSSMIITEGFPTEISGKKTIKKVDKEFAKEIIGLTMYKSQDGEMGALAGLRSDNVGSDIFLLSPRRSKIKTTKPVFIWEPKRQFENYKITLFDYNGIVWSEKTSKTHLEYPENKNPLKQGESYFWQVEGEELFKSTKSNNMDFIVPAKDDLQEILKKEKSIKEFFKENPKSSTLYFILGSFYANRGFYKDAIFCFQQISKANEKAHIPHEILGELYKKIGLKDRAIEELQIALKLR